MSLNVLMLSSSKVANSDYLSQPKPFITKHLGAIKDILFIPYAGVSVNWDDYVQKVQTALPELNINGIHQYPDPAEAVAQANAILVGGGNTFNLLAQLYAHNLLEPIKQRAQAGVPYIGWSAGSNICGLSIKTTNDMPIIQPPSFDALGFVNAQLNPHYTEYVAPLHNGETRDQRIQEFCILEPQVNVIGIEEGSGLLLQDEKLVLVGTQTGVVFKGNDKQTVPVNADLSEFGVI